METLTHADLLGLFDRVAQIMEQNASILCDMDARMGDGDLGLTMRKGFGAIPDALRALDEPDIGKCLMKAGMKMASAAPSTMGTLMASGIMAGAKALAGRTQMDAAAYAGYLRAFAQGIMSRGKCAPGDRTVLDAALPAAEYAEAALRADADASLMAVANEALKGAWDGVEQTRRMVPKFGKAAVFSSRAQESVDQGAYAAALMLQGCYDYISA